ncbi:MAG: DUF2461 domain-containing protein [Lentimicrobium sp.]|nr:DUF2461 domain-containing protein [Lentimicrobium sp.]
MKEILNFLELLESNNNKEWFNANKVLYQEARKKFETVISAVIGSVSAFDNTLGLPSAKETIFRIYRDVRFAKDKTPYKTNMGAFISSGGRKGSKAGYYFHIEPGKSFVGGGIYMPETDQLKKIRQEIYFNANEFKAIISDKKFKAVFGSLSTWDKLKRPPKDYPADFPEIELLMYKSYVVVNYLKDKEVESEDFFEKAVGICKTLKPMNDFLNRAVEN